MNWKWFAMIGVKKEYMPSKDDYVYNIYVDDDFEEVSNYVGVGDGYDCIEEIKFRKKHIGYITDSTFKIMSAGILNCSPMLAKMLIPILKEFGVENYTTDTPLSDHVVVLFENYGIVKK